MNRQRTLRITAWLAALALIAAPIVAAMNGWLASDRWPFRQLSVHGAFAYVSVEEVRAAALPALQPGYFAVDLNQVRENVRNLPWIEHADVRKRWPDRIEISVTEREPIAHWGADTLLSQRGDLFVVPDHTVPEGLPQFDGPIAYRRHVRDFYRQARTALDPLGLTPSRIALNDRGGWTLTLPSGGELLIGRDGAEQRLIRFATVFSELADADASRLLRADLRYENGFALRWSPLQELSPPASSAPAIEATPAVSPIAIPPGPART